MPKSPYRTERRRVQQGNTQAQASQTNRPRPRSERESHAFTDIIVCTATLSLLQTVRVFTLPREASLETLHHAIQGYFGFSGQAQHQFTETAGRQHHRYRDDQDPHTDPTRHLDERRYLLHLIAH